jgi:hypothetical protein
LKKIAQELVAAARAGIRVIVRRILRKYGYRPADAVACNA